MALVRRLGGAIMSEASFESIGIDIPRPSRRQLIIRLAWLAVGLIASVGIAVSGTIRPVLSHEDMSDHRFYRHVADRVVAGEDYYDVACVELLTHGFPPSSAFNWRTPLYAYMLGWLREPAWAQAALALLAVMTAAIVVAMITRELGPIAGQVAGCAVLGASAWWLDPEPPCFTEIWAGQLILLAIAARSLGLTWLGFVAGSLALFLRELVLPFIGLCLVDASVRRKWPEVVAWVTCLLVYGVHLLWHFGQVARQLPGLSVSKSAGGMGWVAWGGARFVLATVRMNYGLASLPAWCAAIYLPLAVFGLIALGNRIERSRWSLIGMSGYLMGFAVVGKPFNDYWGWITCPVLALGFATSPFFLTPMIRTLVLKEPPIQEIAARQQVEIPAASTKIIP